MRLQEKVAVVTGGGRGIGRAIALAFAREGADVAVTGRTTHEIENVAAEITRWGVRGWRSQSILVSVTPFSRVSNASSHTFPT